MRVHSVKQALLIAPVMVAVNVVSACTAPATVAYDEAREVVVLVTPGPIRSAQVMETWTWDGMVWTRQAPATSPSVRSSALLAYDESRRVTVLLDGMGRSDIWEWVGANWSQSTPPHSPDAVQ